MSGFLTKLCIEADGDSDTGQWVLTAPLIYTSDAAKSVIVVPRGFTTDFASVPRLPLVYWATGGVATKAAVVHDFAYSCGQFPRKMCDEIFREACAVIGVSPWRRWLLWAGVRIGGSSHYTPAPT